MTEKVSAQLYRELIEAAKTPQRKESLRRIKQACDLLDKAPAPITPASVAKQCEDLFGGPKEQSIRNSTQVLLAYVKARAAEQILSAQKKRDSGEPPIADEAVRAYVQLLKAKLYEAEQSKNRMIAGVRMLSPLDARGIQKLLDDNTPGEKQILTPTHPAISEVQLNEEERQAFREFLDETHLQTMGITIEYGNLVFPSGKTLLRKAGVEFLQRLLRDI
jgi:hypothetical protein